MTRIYLDHAATTNILPEVRSAMEKAMANWANPSSVHAEGRKARAMMEDARRRLLKAFGGSRCTKLVFTSGASEALQLALGRSTAARVAVGATEHDVVLRAAPDAFRLPVDTMGRIRADALSDWLESDKDAPALVCVQQVNNETGVVQDISGLSAIVREAGGVFLCDAAQSAGKMSLPDADIISISAHKIGGPPGIGALLLTDESLIRATGGQERGLRGGTENLPAIVGFAAALDVAADWQGRCLTLQQRLEEAVLQAGGEVISRPADRVPWITAVRMVGTAATTQLMHFDLAGIAVSAGAACSSGSMKTSHVLRAMGLDETSASEVIRISFAPHTNETDVDAFLEAWHALALRQSEERGGSKPGRAEHRQGNVL